MSLTVEQWLLHGDGSAKSPKLNEQQQLAVKTVANTVTAAGAGSGKTFVLARRFAYLVCVHGYKVSQILTLTFTRKATSEMYERIYRTLEEVANKFDDQSAVQAINEFFTAKIQTLDAYCSYIIKMKSHFYGIAPNFSIDKEKAVEIARQQALPFLLSHKDNRALQDLARTNPLDVLAEELFVSTILEYSTVCNPIPFKTQIERQKDFAVERWNETANRALALINELKSLNEEFGSPQKKFFIQLSQLLELAEPEKKDFRQFFSYVSTIAKISLVGQRQEYNPCCSVVKDLKKLCETLGSLMVFLEKYPLLLDLVPLLEEFQGCYNKEKCQKGILTFADAAQLALKILMECDDIRQSEKEAYKAIMIDEFQDDNALQKEMLYCLAERLDILVLGKVPAVNLDPNKLFFVGDEKQSIYRFRGADVSVFRSLAEELNRSSCCENKSLLQLSFNYRSQPDLIDSFNRIFGGSPSVFKVNDNESSNSLPSYEAVYTNIYAGKEAQKNRHSQCHVHVRLFDCEQDKDDKKRLSSDECEAVFVAQKVAEIISQEKMQPKDIAVLFRTKTHQHLFEKQLRLHGVPYVTDSLGSLFADAPANDIYNFLWLCCYPADFSAYAAVLRSPFVSLSHNALQKVLCLQEIVPFDVCAANLLEGDEKDRYLHGCMVYKKLSGMIGRCSITDVLSFLWYYMGYRYETLWNATVKQYSELYDILFALAHKADLAGKSIVWFLDSLSDIASGKTRMEDMDVPLERGNAVSLMTIHASKGLEFPVVFVCGCGGTGQMNKNDKAVYFSREWGVTLNLPSEEKGKNNFFYELAKNNEELEDQAELRRLLYVAMTRAEDELYLTGTIKFPLEEKNEEERRLRSFTDLLMPLFCHFVQQKDGQYFANNDSPFSFGVIPSFFRGETESKAIGTKPTKTIYKNTAQGKRDFVHKIESVYKDAFTVEKEEMPSVYRTPSSFERVVFESNGALESEDEITAIVKSSARADGSYGFSYADFGSAAHLYLEAWLNDEKPVFPAKLVQNLSGKARESLCSVCKKMAQEFSCSATGIQVRNASWFKTEYDFKYKTGGCILNGTMDLIFLNPDGTYSIVDYKTDYKEMPEKYYIQQAAYRKAASAMLGCPEQNITCLLYYLRSGNVVDITNECAAVQLEDIIKCSRHEESF